MAIICLSNACRRGEPPPKPKPKADSSGADLTDGVKVAFGPRERATARPSCTVPIMRICAEAGSSARPDELRIFGSRVLALTRRRANRAPDGSRSAFPFTSLAPAA